jgi:hypothetical protein
VCSLLILKLLLLVTVQANADLTQQLADHGRLLRALREQASDMAAHLGAAQDTLASKERLIEQLKSDLASLTGDSPGISGTTTPSYSLAHRTSSSGSPGTVGSPSMLRGLSRQSSKSAVAAHNGVGKVRAAARQAYSGKAGTACKIAEGQHLCKHCSCQLVGCPAVHEAMCMAAYRYWQRKQHTAWTPDPALLLLCVLCCYASGCRWCLPGRSPAS